MCKEGLLNNLIVNNNMVTSDHLDLLLPGGQVVRSAMTRRGITLATRCARRSHDMVDISSGHRRAELPGETATSDQIQGSGRLDLGRKGN